MPPANPPYEGENLTPSPLDSGFALRAPRNDVLFSNPQRGISASAARIRAQERMPL
jgi:hypothetical protein